MTPILSSSFCKMAPHSVKLAEQSGCPLLDRSKDTFKIKVSHRAAKNENKICFLLLSVSLQNPVFL